MEDKPMLNPAASLLVIEDEKKIADSLQQGLEESGYNVKIAYDGTIGEKLFQQNDIDLVLLDVNLPGINGLDLCKRFRQKKSSVAILMLTTLGSLPDKIDGFNAGADDYLAKPFSFAELVLRIRALLRRKDTGLAPTSNVLQIADLQMNIDTKQVSRSGKSIQLTAKEFQLLEYFLRNKNRVLSRADIAEQVWNIDFDTHSNTIDVYVNYLRKKVDKDFEDKLIHTQVGFGYIMKEKNR
jgi:two-component system copper resistance phosphate regulon response regulator CusR